MTLNKTKLMLDMMEDLVSSHEYATWQEAAKAIMDVAKETGQDGIVREFVAWYEEETEWEESYE